MSKQIGREADFIDGGQNAPRPLNTSRTSRHEAVKLPEWRYRRRAELEGSEEQFIFAYITDPARFIITKVLNHSKSRCPTSIIGNINFVYSVYRERSGLVILLLAELNGRKGEEKTE